MVAAVALALLLSLNNKDAIVAVAPRPPGLAAPPNAGMHNGMRGLISRIRYISLERLFCNLLALADYMEEYLGIRRCTNRFDASALLLNLSRIVSPKFATINLRSQSGKPMTSSTFVANAATRIISFVGQITSHMLPTGDKRSDWV